MFNYAMALDPGNWGGGGGGGRGGTNEKILTAQFNNPGPTNSDSQFVTSIKILARDVM